MLTTEATHSTHVPAEDDWLTLKQAASWAHCSERTLRRLIAKGKLRHARIGAGADVRKKPIRLRPSWVGAALEACATPIEFVK